jgi:hypothetical protein
VILHPFFFPQSVSSKSIFKCFNLQMFLDFFDAFCAYNVGFSGVCENE